MIGPTVGRDPDELVGRVLVGPAEECVERLAQYAEVGVHRAFLWPVGEGIEQLELFGEHVRRFSAAEGIQGSRA